MIPFKCVVRLAMPLDERQKTLYLSCSMQWIVHNDSIIYQQPPDYLTNTLDSLEVFEIENVKAGRYLLIAQKDIANNYTFDQNADDIGFINDFIDLPTDSLFHLDLFREKTNFSVGRTFQQVKIELG